MARSLPGPSYNSCLQSPRPSMSSLQIYLHNKAANLDSLLLKSKQNKRALPMSPEREGSLAHTLLPRQGAALTRLQPCVFHSIFQNCLFLPFRILPRASAFLLLTQICSSGRVPPQAWCLCPWTWGVQELLGSWVTVHVVRADESPFYSANIY